MRSWGITCSLLLAIPHLFAFPIVRRSLYTPEYHLQAILHIRQDVSIDPRAQVPLQDAQPSQTPAQTPHVEPTSGGPSPAVFVFIGIVIAGALAAIGFLLFRCVCARRVAPSAEFASPSSQEIFRASWFSWSRRATPPPSQRWKQRPARAGSSFSRDMTISQIQGPPIVTAPPQSAYIVQPQTIVLQDPPPPPRRGGNHGRNPSQPPVGENPFTDRHAVTLPPPPPPPPPIEPRLPPPIAPQVGPGAPQHEVIRPAPLPPPPPPPIVPPVVAPAPVPPPVPTPVPVPVPPSTLARPPIVAQPIPPTPRETGEADITRQTARTPSPAGTSTPSLTGPSRPITPVAANTATTTRPQSVLTRGTSATGTIRGARPMPSTPGAHRPTGPRPILRVNTLTHSEGEALATSVEPPSAVVVPAHKESTERRVEFVPAEPPRKQEGGTALGHKKQDSLTIPSATAPASAAAATPRDSSISPALPNPPVTPTPPTYIPFSFTPESPVGGTSGSSTPAPLKKRGPPVGIASALASAMGHNSEEVEPPQTVKIIKRGLSAQAVAAKKRAEEADTAKEQATTKRKYDSDDDVPRRSGFA